VGLVVVLLASAGCVGQKNFSRRERGTYLQGYRAGVSAQIGDVVEGLNGNDFPYLDGSWSAPLVQDVIIPAHIADGVFYPRHAEPVIITPGEWKKSGAFPLSVPVVQSPTHSGAFIVADITPMPGSGQKITQGELE
jgi:hypothetical protein